jgi:outer membrane protein assembly factor BamB
VIGAGIVLALALPRQAAHRASEPGAAILVGVDIGSGKPQWETVVGRSSGANLTVGQVTDGVVLTVRQRCLSQDRAYRVGDLEVIAFDAKSGKELWSRRDATLAYPGYASFGYRTSGGIVLLQTTQGTLEGVTLRTGKSRWSRRTTTRSSGGNNAAFGDQFGIMGTIGGVLVTSTIGAVLTTGREPQVQGWDQATGRPKWKRALTGERVTTFGSDGRELYALTTAPASSSAGAPGGVPLRIQTVSPQTGATIRSLDLGTVPYPATVFVATGSSFVAGAWTNAGAINAFDRQSGIAKWQHNGFLQTHVGEVVLVRQEGIPNQVIALDATSGVERWRHVGSGVVAAGAARAAIFDIDPYTNDGTMTMVDAATGAELWTRSEPPLRFGGATHGTAVLAFEGCRATSND